MAERLETRAVEVDLRGQVCPATLLKALQELNRLRDALKSGATVLVILTDHRDATVTIPDAASSMGYEVAVKKEGSHYRIAIAGHGAAARAEAAP